MSNFKAMTLTGDEFKLRASRVRSWLSASGPRGVSHVFKSLLSQKLSKKLDGQFVVLAVSTDDSNTIAGVRKIVRQKKLKMPIS